MKVLLAIDSSTGSEEVIDVVAKRPWPVGSAFCVMSVVDMGRWEGLPALIEDARQEAERSLKAAIERLTKAVRQVSSEVQIGFPKKAIPEYAKQWGADLIMVGSHGHSGLTRFLLGSVAQAVLRSAPCSVEVVRSGSVASSRSDVMKILLATDGSEGSAKAVYAIANRPWPANSEIKVVSVVQLLTPENQATASPLCSEYPTRLLEQIWEDARTRAEEAVCDARNTLTAKGLNVCHKSTPVGDARALILDESKAWGADLIVLGSHGRHGLDRMLIGSVSESVALHAQCSVEVIRH